MQNLGVTSEFINADGVKLHVAKAGKGPAVVLLHGFPEFWYSWRYQIPALVEAGFSVFAPDQRGYNLSDKPAGRDAYHLVNLIDDVAHLVGQSGLKRIHLVAHDWGGIVAWGFAHRYPELLDKLIILNAPHVAIHREKSKQPPQMFRSWYIGFFCLPRIPEWVLSAGNYAAIREMFTDKVARKNAFSPEDIEKYVEAISRPGALAAALNWYRSGVLTSGGLKLAVEAHTDAPTLVIWGEKDPALDISLLDGLERYATNLTIHRIPDVSHWVQNEAPDEVNRVMIKFLRGD